MKNHSELNHKVSFFKRRIPAYWLLISLIVVTSAAALLASHTKPKKEIVTAPATIQNEKAMPAAQYVRINGFRYAHPLLLVNSQAEDPSLFYLKDSVNKFIESEKAAGLVNSVSVYFKKMDAPSWFSINPEEEYVCASLFKVPVMMAIFMEEDKHPGYLNRTVQYLAPPGFMENVNPLIKGKFYALRQLVQSMVSRSDNIAYNLCWNQMPIENFNKILNDFQTKPFNVHDTAEYTLSVKEYSKFFRVLYNARMLSPQMSDLALKFLAESDFDAGLMRGVTDSIPVARKFGLRTKGSNVQLHEFGIVYIEGSPYLLGVMTKGSDEKNLYSVLGGVSAIVYGNIKSGRKQAS